MRHRQFPMDKLPKMIAEYESGDSLFDLQVRYNWSAEAIRDRMANAGVKIRTAQEQLILRPPKRFTNRENP